MAPGPPPDEVAHILQSQGDSDEPQDTDWQYERIVFDLFPGDCIICGIDNGGLLSLTGPWQGCNIVCTKKAWVCIAVPPAFAGTSAKGGLTDRLHIAVDRVVGSCWQGQHIPKSPARHRPPPPPAPAGVRCSIASN